MADKDDTQGRADEVTDMTDNQADLYAYIEANFPWVVELGLEDLMFRMIREDASWDEIYSNIIKTPEYKEMFPGIRREDGSLRYRSEAEYLQAVDDYRSVLKDFGSYDPATDSPSNYLFWIENDVDPNELEERFQMYNALDRGTRELRDAFYIYAGLDVSVDDMYNAIVDPTYQRDLGREYDQRVTASPITYPTWLERTAKVAMDHVAEMMFDLQEQGVVDEAFVRQILSSDPAAVLQMADGIAATAYQNGTYLTADELQTAFSYALIGSAATRQGLTLTDKARVQQFIEAGVTQAQANQAYSQYAQQRFGLLGMARRANVQDINRDMYERATLLQEGDMLSLLNRVTKQETALGRTGSQFSTDLDESGRITQRGR
jgi:hypothetical protein